MVDGMGRPTTLEEVREKSYGAGYMDAVMGRIYKHSLTKYLMDIAGTYYETGWSDGRNMKDDLDAILGKGNALS